MNSETIQANNMAADIYAAILSGQKDVQRYLQNKRGLKPETITKYKLGYAHDKDILINTLQANDLVYDHLADADGERDYFHNRIIFPCLMMGNVVFFTSRAFPTGTPTHRHMRGDIEYLYNEEGVLQKEYVFVVESPICALTLLQSGINAIAKLGSRKEILKKIPKDKRIYFVPDNDPNQSGLKDVIRCTAYLASQGYKKMRVVCLPSKGEKEDVNSFVVKYGIEKFRKIAKQGIKPKTLPPVGEISFVSELNKYNKPADNRIKEWGDDIDMVKRSVPLSQVVKDYVPELVPMDAMIQCCCPFHNENKPSFTIYPPKSDGYENWFCFGCDFGGDVITFIQRIEELSFRQAVDLLKRKYL